VECKIGEEEDKVSYETLSSFLGNCEDFPWSDALYVETTDLKLDVRVMTHDPDDADEDESPDIIKKLGFVYLISVQDVQAIKENIIDQVGRSCSVDDVFCAFLFYLKNDAYIVAN